jgi:hypothetical protein
MKRASWFVAVVTGVALAVTAAAPAGAAGSNLIGDSSFERPKVTEASGVHSITGPQVVLGQCTSPGNTIGCWRTAGDLDIVRDSVWQAKAGSQSVQLHTGAGAGSLFQEVYSPTPGKARLSFFLSANPAAKDNLGVELSIASFNGSGNEIPGTRVVADYSYYDGTHTAANMKYAKQSLVYSMASEDVRFGLQAIGFLGDPAVGPVIDKVSFKLI